MLVGEQVQGDDRLWLSRSDRLDSEKRGASRLIQLATVEWRPVMFELAPPWFEKYEGLNRPSRWRVRRLAPSFLPLVLLMLGSGRLGAGEVPFPTEHTVDGDFNSAHSVYAADVDGDGDLDVLGAAVVADDIAWWENTAGDGTAWTEHTVDGDFDAARCRRHRSARRSLPTTCRGTNVLGAAELADDIAWWENTAGDGTAWTEHPVDGDFDAARSVFAADVDGDGDLDVLGAAGLADDIAWWENTLGDGTAWTEHPVDVDFDFARSVFAADVDGDGDLDVLGAAGLADDIAWWENTAGDGTAWTEHPVDGAFDNAASVYAADVDGDGDLDVLGAAGLAGDIAWWENTAGDGTAWTEHPVDVGLQRRSFRLCRRCGRDGDLDVLGAALNADDIAWWENTAGIPPRRRRRGLRRRCFRLCRRRRRPRCARRGAQCRRHHVVGEHGRGRHGLDRAHRRRGLRQRFPSMPPTWTGTATSMCSARRSLPTTSRGGRTPAGDGTAWTVHTVDGAFDGARSVFAADVDGDGDLDVLGAATAADDIDVLGEHGRGRHGLDRAHRRRRATSTTASTPWWTVVPPMWTATATSMCSARRLLPTTSRGGRTRPGTAIRPGPSTPSTAPSTSLGPSMPPTWTATAT